MARVLTTLAAMAVLPALAAAVSVAADAETIGSSRETTAVARYSEQTWLDALLRCGDGSPVSKNWQGRIFRTSAGRLYVPSDTERRTVAALRRDQDARQLVAECLAAIPNTTTQGPAVSAPEAMGLASRPADGAQPPRRVTESRFNLGLGLSVAAPTTLLAGTITAADDDSRIATLWETKVLSAR